MVDKIIQCSGIKKSFANKEILKDGTFSLYKGEILGLVGVSGSGKTTLLRILMGFYKPDGGVIEYFGEDVTHKTEKIRHTVGLCTQENSFYKDLTVEENLRYYAQMYAVPTKEIVERTHHLLELVGLQDHARTKAKNLSGGMARRLDFAISLVHNPDILVLDEPTMGLDPTLRKAIWKIIKQVQALGKTILVTSHFFDELELDCTRIAVLHKGKILAIAPISWYYEQLPQSKSLTEIFEACTRETT